MYTKKEIQENIKDTLNSLAIAKMMFNQAYKNELKRFLVIGKAVNSTLWLSTESFDTLKEAITYINIESTQFENDNIILSVVDTQNKKEVD